jgi:hypothetical protein
MKKMIIFGLVGHNDLTQVLKFKRCLSKKYYTKFMFMGEV